MAAVTGRETPRRQPKIDLEARHREELVTPADVTVVSVMSPDPTMTGSLPVLRETQAALATERGGKHVERTTAEQRRDDLEAQYQEIEKWWRAVTDVDIDDTLPKALEYGAGDLDHMGQGLLMLQGDVWEGGDEKERRAVGQELAILFYISGKVSRALAAAQQGRRMSDDTIRDIRVYSVMLQRVRDTGKWIG